MVKARPLECWVYGMALAAAADRTPGMAPIRSSTSR
jgi:hypothetical protein